MKLQCSEGHEGPWDLLYTAFAHARVTKLEEGEFRSTILLDPDDCEADEFAIVPDDSYWLECHFVTEDGSICENRIRIDHSQLAEIKFDPGKPDS